MAALFLGVMLIEARKCAGPLGRPLYKSVQRPTDDGRTVSIRSEAEYCVGVLGLQPAKAREFARIADRADVLGLTMAEAVDLGLTKLREIARHIVAPEEFENEEQMRETPHIAPADKSTVLDWNQRTDNFIDFRDGLEKHRSHGAPDPRSSQAEALGFGFLGESGHSGS
jgi:hypothetical protein